MARFLFHLHESGAVTKDEEGRELTDLAMAQRYAETAARAIISADVEEGALCLGCFIEIENSQTGQRNVVAFRDVVHITCR
ncbi:MAG: hypothetical protein K2P79_06755 [Sphingomonas sp.]|nr:hypothetical protein [Sphingomonas sp.]